MAGHSKWAKVKHFKGAIDAKRGKTFSKLSKQSATPPKLAGGDRAMNPRLRMVLLKSPAANAPNDNIDPQTKNETAGGKRHDSKRYTNKSRAKASSRGWRK